MNRWLERNKELLTPQEQNEIWRRIQDRRARSARRAWSWRVPVYAGGLVAAVVIAMLLRSGFEPPKRLSPPPVHDGMLTQTEQLKAQAKAPDQAEIDRVMNLTPEGAERSPAEARRTDEPTPALEAPKSTLETPASDRRAPVGEDKGASPPLQSDLPPSLSGAPGQGHAEPSPADRVSEPPSVDVVQFDKPVGTEGVLGVIAPKTPAASKESASEPATASGDVGRAASAPPVGAPPPSSGSVTKDPGSNWEKRFPPRAPEVRDVTSAPHGSAGEGTISGSVRDLHGKTLAYANVMVEGTQWGAFSQEDGSFRIPNIPAGQYTVLCNLIGFADQRVENVEVRDGRTVTVDFRLEDKPLGAMPEVEVQARREVIARSPTEKSQDAAGSASPQPSNVQDLIALKAGVIAKGGEIHSRGGRSNESLTTLAPGVPLQFHAAQPPVIPYTGGNALPNDEPYDAMFFEHYGVNPFIPTDEDALSTFAVDVDNASYTLMRRFIELGNLPDKDAVRVEEFVNFFPQGYPKFEDTDFRIYVDGAPSPFGDGYHLLRVGIQGRVIEEYDRKPATLVFVIDVSGSMAREDRLELVKRALNLLVDRLRPGDEVGIVVYGSQGRVLLDPLRIGDDDEIAFERGRDRDHRRGWGDPDDQPGWARFTDARYRGARERIRRVIDSVYPEGSTNAEEGIRLGYELAREAYRPGAINRIILCSDGVANVGRTGPDSILEEVKSQADRGITLTTAGFGMGNYNDVLMEQLADRGDGNYYYVDDLDEARRVFVENLTGTLQVIAKDAKIQVEFDPKQVLRYRLLGFENRDVADRDFRNDKVDAGEIGAGHRVVALYEVKLAEGVEAGRLATVRFRYAKPERELAEERRVREIEQSFDAAELERRFRDARPEFRLDAAVAEFAEILRKSFYAKESSLGEVERVARDAAADLRSDEADEFVRIVRKAQGLAGEDRPE